ncbi:hypothetical protein AB4059_00670 [Lysobacter sp. 2RAF19]
MCVFLQAALSMPFGAQAQQWRTVSDKDDIRIERRSIPGERYDELRLSTSLNASPKAIAGYLFGNFLDQSNKNVTRTFIRRGRDVTIWSDVLRLSMMRARCYSVRFERHNFANGEIRVTFASLDFIGKKPMPDCIALHSRGEWIMTPTNAKTRLTYVSLTDIGGNVPVFLADHSLSSAAVLSIRKVVAGASGLPLPEGIAD